MTYQTKPNILIVDDDEAICKTLSAILQTRGYETVIATTAKGAIEKTKSRFFNIALLDIKLPDMEGTRLLAHLQETTPETMKIMVTGYPSLKNAVEALNLGAHSYMMKPIDPADLLKKIEKGLKTQQQDEKTTKEKLAKWIQSQARKVHSSNFGDFLEETATELINFGLTKTQAKIYISLIALDVASTSEIANLSKIRREEVYRILPELEKQGIVTRKLETPRKFSAIPPNSGLQLLINKKLDMMKKEIDKLNQEQTELTPKLETIRLTAEKKDCFIDVIRTQDNAIAKLIEMTQKATQKIDVVAPFEDLKIAYANRPRKLRERLLKSVKMRIITQKCELDAFTKEILQSSKADNNPIEIIQLDKLPFNLMIVDDKEAIWGETTDQRDDPQSFWTNDSTQIAILKASFENLWQNQRTRKHAPYTRGSQIRR